MKKLVAAAMLVSIVALTGCYRHTYTTSAVPQAVPADWSWRHHILWGLVALDEHTQLDALCPQGVARIENAIGPLQVLLHIITAGIYTPTQVRVYCRADAVPVNSVPVEVQIQIDPGTVSDLLERYPDLEERLSVAIEQFRAEESAFAIRPEAGWL